MASYQTGPFTPPQPIPHASQHPAISPRSSRYIPADYQPADYQPDNTKDEERAYMPASPLSPRPPMLAANSYQSNKSEPPHPPYPLNTSSVQVADTQFDRQRSDSLHPSSALGVPPYGDPFQRRLSVDQIPQWQAHSGAPFGGPNQQYGRRKSFDASSSQPDGYSDQRPRPTSRGRVQPFASGEPAPEPTTPFDDGFIAGFQAGRSASRQRSEQAGNERRASQAGRGGRRSDYDDEGSDSYEEDRRARRSSQGGQGKRDRDRDERRRQRRSSEVDRRPTISDSIESALFNIKRAFGTGGR